MKTTTISYEYDDEGRVTKETRVEFDTPIPAACVCAQTVALVAHRSCPVHGLISPPTVTRGTVGTADPSMVLRSTLPQRVFHHI